MAPAFDKDYVLKTVEERDVKFIRFWFTDVLGVLKSFAVTDSELEGAFEEGMGFDGSSIDGFTRIQESDMVAFPDANTFQTLPWRPEEQGVGRMFADIQRPDGKPFEGDPRYALKRMLKKAADMGYTMYVGPELEFFYFADDESTQIIDKGGYFDLTPLDIASDLRRDTVLTLEKMGIPVEYSHHEVAPSQHEIDLRYQDALTMADAVMTYRLVVKEVAMANGVYATFMPKPMEGENGSGMHTHQSLFTKDGNAFYDASKPGSPQRRLPPLHRRAAQVRAGVLRGHQPACQLLQAPGSRLRGPHLRLVGAGQPLGDGPRAALQARQGGCDPHRAAEPGPLVQPVPRVRGHARRRPQGHRGEARAHARGDQRHLRDERRRARRGRNQDPAQEPWARPSSSSRSRRL